MKPNIISVNAKVGRSVNRAMILNLIREKQPISRIQIARLTGLNRSTVSSIVNMLLEEELIFEEMTADKNIGRNPINLRLKSGRYFVGAVNIDKSVTKIAISDIDGSLKAKGEIETRTENPSMFFSECVDAVYNLAKNINIEKLEGIGFTITGIVDSENLIVKYSPILGWEDFDIKEAVSASHPEITNIAAENDAKASALAELWFGKQETDLSNFVFVSVGAGIGSGVVVSSNLLNGEFSAAGEFGHMTLTENGALCSCGLRGCWEAYASDKATIKRYVEISAKDEDFDIQDIIDRALKGEVEAAETMKQTGHYLGLGIINIVKSIDPHSIIVGGKIVKAWEIVYPEIIKVIEERTFFGSKKNIRILPTSLETRPRLLGAATLAIRQIFDDYKIMV